MEIITKNGQNHLGKGQYRGIIVSDFKTSPGYNNQHNVILTENYINRSMEWIKVQKHIWSISFQQKNQNNLI